MWYSTLHMRLFLSKSIYYKRITDLVINRKEIALRLSFIYLYKEVVNMFNSVLSNTCNRTVALRIAQEMPTLVASI